MRLIQNSETPFIRVTWAPRGHNFCISRTNRHSSNTNKETQKTGAYAKVATNCQEKGIHFHNYLNFEKLPQKRGFKPRRRETQYPLVFLISSK